MVRKSSLNIVVVEVALKILSVMVETVPIVEVDSYSTGAHIQLAWTLPL